MMSLATAVGLLAYVGPGPGLSMTAALVGLLATVAIALFAFFSWPIRVLLRKIRGGSAEEEAESEEEPEPDEQADDAADDLPPDEEE